MSKSLKWEKKSKLNGRKRRILPAKDVLKERKEKSYAKQINFVDQKLLHKERPENVHIYNLRRSLPVKIPGETFENSLLPHLNKMEKSHLLKYYFRVDTKKDENIKDGNGSFYILRSIPNTINITDLDRTLRKNICSADKEFLMKFYGANFCETEHTLQVEAKELDDLRILNLLSKKELSISDNEKVKISELLERYEEINKEEVYFANLHIDPGHYYFFEHKLDHVPGMLIIEAARQIFTAVSHIYGKVPVDNISYILTRMEVDLQDYLWLSYPVRIKLTMEEISKDPENRWSNCTARISFHQEFKEKGSIRVNGMALPNQLLETIVNKKKTKNIMTRGITGGGQDRILLTELNNPHKGITGTIVDISPKNFLLDFMNDTHLPENCEYRFNIKSGKYITASGNCAISWCRKESERSMACFNITGIDADNLSSLTEITSRLRISREIDALM